MEKIEPLAVSRSQAAEMIGVSLRTLQKYIQANQLPTRRIGRRNVIEVRDLRAFLESDHAPIAKNLGSNNW